MKTIPYEFVEVTWQDAASYDEWRDVDYNFQLPQAVSRGWLVQDKEEYVVLAAGWVQDGDDMTGGPWDVIPKGMIKEIRKIDGGRFRTSD